MAGREPSISRRRILGAAASLPIAALAGAPADCAPVEAADAALWERRLATYRQLASGATQAAERGWFRAANDRYYREGAAIAARFGGEEAAARSQEASEAQAAAFGRIERAENIYWRRYIAPLHEAAVALVLTPAPDLPSLRDKIAAMRAHALDELDAMPRDALDVVDEDVGRLIARTA